MARKSKATLSKQSSVDQEAIFAHCETVPLEAGAKWLLAEFGIESPDNPGEPLSTTTLSKWLIKMRGNKSTQEVLSNLGANKDRAQLINKSFSAAGFTVAASTLIGQCIFEELLKPIEDRDEKRIGDLMVHALKARDQELKERALNLDVDKFQWDASKAAIEKAKEIKTIIADKSLTDDARIEQVRLRLFGKPSEAGRKIMDQLQGAKV